MSKRTINSELLKKWIAEKGSTARARLALDAEISVSLVDKLVAGTYGSVPKDYVRERICSATRLDEADLFPLVASKGKRSA